MKFSELDKSTQIILKVILAGVLLALLWAIRDIIILLLLAFILASAMEPVVTYLHAKKIPRVVSVLAVYVLVLGLAALIIYLIVPPVLMQFKILQGNLPGYSHILQTRYAWLFGGAGVSQLFQQLVGGQSSGGVLSNTFGAFNGILDFIAVLVIAFYLVAEQNGMNHFVGSIIPADSRKFAMGLITKIQNKMGMWVLGQIIVSLGIFIFTFVGLQFVLHVQFALVLALIAGFLEIIPYIGPFISAIPAMFIAFIQHPILALWVAILYVLVHEFEAYLLVPKIMERTVGTSPLVTMVALLIGYQLAGIVGLLISVPLAAAITVAINEFWPSKAV